MTTPSPGSAPPVPVEASKVLIYSFAWYVRVCNICGEVCTRVDRWLYIVIYNRFSDCTHESVSVAPKQFSFQIWALSAPSSVDVIRSPPFSLLLTLPLLIPLSLLGFPERCPCLPSFACVPYVCRGFSSPSCLRRFGGVHALVTRRHVCVQCF